MKLQCSCGTKHQFDITPEMATSPVRFVCPVCGLDASQFVDQLVRQELGQSETPPGAPVTINLGAPAAGAAPPVPVPAPPRPRAFVMSPPPPAPAEAPDRAKVVARVHSAEPAPAETIEGTPCLKHLGEVAVEKCYVCSKPICPKCMDLFGYVCSPLCKAKADSHGIAVPVYENQRTLVEARRWRKMVHIFYAVGGVAVVFIGVWIWYAWFGQVPRPIFAVRFPEPSFSGQSVFCGPGNSQIVFLHGGTLARYDLKSKQEIWSRELVDRRKIAEEADREIKEMQQRNVRLSDHGAVDLPRIPAQDKLIKELYDEAAAELSLHVRGQNVWVSESEKLVRLNWDDGKPVKELAVPRGYGSVIQREDELFVVNTDSGKPMVTRVNLATSQLTTEELLGSAARMVASQAAEATNAPGGKPKKPAELAGLPIGRPGKDAGKAMDPAKVAEEAQHLPFPVRVALPAMIAGNLNQERALAELAGPNGTGGGAGEDGPIGSVSLIPTANGFVQFSVKLLEERKVERSAMKAAPGKSVLDGDVSVGKSLEAASELLNEMQRERGGDKVVEDLSRYQVGLKKLGEAEGWTGEVIGPPTIYPLKSVNVIAAYKQIIVLDKANRKLWGSPLSYNVEGGLGALEEEGAVYGQGPCVERNDTLYVFDEGVLSAFDLRSGNARWRLPSVGIVGIFFDEKGMIYVNTTTASPDSLKYSRQIDLSSKVDSVVMKVDPRNGKVLWSTVPGGLVNYASGNILLVVQYYQPLDLGEGGPSFSTGFEPTAYLRVKRLNPRNGTEMWEHFQQRAPLDIAFDKNTIRLVFKKEVQVLKFMNL